MGKKVGEIAHGKACLIFWVRNIDWGPIGCSTQTGPILVSGDKEKVYKNDTSGLYYKRITIEIDAPSVVSK